MSAPESENDGSTQNPLKARDVIQNIWILFLYAADLAKFRNHFRAEVDESPDLKSLIARLLHNTINGRLRRGLSFHHRQHENVLDRVRGRIDVLNSFSRGLFERGRVACRYNELTLDTPRNRYARAALIRLSTELRQEENVDDEQVDLARRCKVLAGVMLQAGVRGDRPSRAELATDQIARHESDDRLMLSLSKAVFDLVLPTERAGLRSFLEASREELKGKDGFPNLYEKAIGNLFKVELSRSDGWQVSQGERRYWNVKCGSSGIYRYMPRMECDIVLTNTKERRRIVIDTKFTDIHSHRFENSNKFKSRHIYQMYAYLRSQEKQVNDPYPFTSEGILLYPTLYREVDETAVIQGHHIRFATVNLRQSSRDFVERLKSIPSCPWSPQG